MSKKNDLIGLQGGRKIARKLSLFFASLSLYQAPLSFQCNVPSLSMRTDEQWKVFLRSLAPRSLKIKGRVSLSLCVCVCVQAERAMSGTLLLLIEMMNADSFVLFSRLCCASCALRPASLLPPGSSSKMLFSSIMQQSVSKASWHRLCPPRAQK